MTNKLSLALLVGLALVGSAHAQISYSKESESSRGGETVLRGGHYNREDHGVEVAHRPSNSIPEPGTLALAGFGALVILRRRRK